VQEAVGDYEAVAAKYGLSGTELALAWCKSRWFVASSIIGATTMAQLKVSGGRGVGLRGEHGRGGRYLCVRTQWLELRMMRARQPRRPPRALAPPYLTQENLHAFDKEIAPECAADVAVSGWAGAGRLDARAPHLVRSAAVRGGLFVLTRWRCGRMQAIYRRHKDPTVNPA
jgi:hypothetical protein